MQKLKICIAGLNRQAGFAIAYVVSTLPNGPRFHVKCLILYILHALGG